jgi:hypothetical protein|tara:strand:+ start:1737 stop:2273 length:537 start_codon:yes stop_codon:yes gene_type:complete
MGKRHLILIEPGTIATRVKLDEDNGIIKSEKSTRAYMAPAERITEYKVRDGKAIRSGEITMFHRDFDLPISLNAGPEPQTVIIPGSAITTWSEHRGDEPAKQTKGPDQQIELGSWASAEGTKLKRWEIADSAYNSEVRAGESIDQAALFGIASSVGLLVAVVFLAVQLALSYGNTPTP